MIPNNVLPYYEQMLRHIRQRIAVSDEEGAYFFSLLRVRQLLPRQYLLQQGDQCRYESYVCHGFLRSFFTDDSGNDHTLHFAMEDWWITDLTSFVMKTSATRSIVAHEKTTLLQIERSDMDKLFVEIPAFERFWRLINEKACMAADERILNNIALSGAARYVALITKYPTIEQRLPQKYIASYLGITPVFLSQIRKNGMKTNR